MSDVNFGDRNDGSIFGILEPACRAPEPHNDQKSGIFQEMRAKSMSLSKNSQLKGLKMQEMYVEAPKLSPELIYELRKRLQNLSIIMIWEKPLILLWGRSLISFTFQRELEFVRKIRCVP